jgi:hypothetical protein
MTTVLDAAKKSPVIVLTNGGLTATFSTTHSGNVAADTAAPSGKSWFEASVDALPAGELWFGFATASHYFGNDGAAWQGGDAQLSAISLNAGGVWPVGQGYAYHDEDAALASSAGHVWMIERDSTITTDSYGSSAPNGVFRVRRGGFTSRTIKLPAGTLYAIVGSSGGAVVSTLNFGATTPVNSINSGYSAYDGGGGGSIVSLVGSASGAGTVSGLAIGTRSLAGALAGVAMVSGAGLYLRSLQGSGAGTGLVSGGWAVNGPVLFTGASQGIAIAGATGVFRGGNPWAAVAIAPETWTRAAAAPEAWIRIST